MCVISVECSLCRTLYDEGEKEQFLENLAQRIRGHEKDIERMCNKNYQGFIESVSELHKVKSDALKLKVRRARVVRNIFHCLFHNSKTEVKFQILAKNHGL